MSGSSVFTALLVLLALQNLAVRLMNLPLNRVIESKFCGDYYRQHDPSKIDLDGLVPEHLCKVDEVQQNLAWTQGTIETVHTACDLLVTIPYGVLADKGFRQIILTFNVIGLATMYSWLAIVGLAFPMTSVGAMIVAPLFSLLGGGDCVFQSSIAAIVAEHATESSARATYFSYISSISYVITLLSPLLSAAAMSLNLCLPFVIGVMLLLMCILVIPGAASPSAPPSILRPEEGAASPLLQRRSSTDLKIDQTGPKSLSTEVKSSLVAIARQLQDRSFCLLLAVFFAASLASSNTPLLPQYISKRYGWSFAEAGILLSTKASINVLLLTIAVPYFIRQRLARPLAVGRTVNITGAKFSLVASIIGAVAIGLSGQIWQLLLAFVVYAIGSVLTVFTMSLVQSCKDIPTEAATEDASIHPPMSSSGAKRYGIVMLARTAGTMLGLPLMAASWAKGISVGDLAMGSPYFLSAAFYVVAHTLLLWHAAY